jgi:hypothetical protein
MSVSVDKEKQEKADPIYVGSVYLATKSEQIAHQIVMKDVNPQLVLASCY